MTASSKLGLLRHQFKDHGINAYLIPQTDIHQNELVPVHYQRLKWLTNFSGSAGLSVVSGHTAALFVDGRYTLQAASEIEGQPISIETYSFDRIKSYLTEHLNGGDVLGFDPWLITASQYRRYHLICEKQGILFKAVQQNIVDQIWPQRPAAPDYPVKIHPIEYTGQLTAEKLSSIGKELKSIKADMAVLTQCESIAWLLNIRGHDLPCTPVMLAFAIVHADESTDLFIDDHKILAEVKNYLGAQVRFYAYNDLATRLKQLAQAKKSIAIDNHTAPYQIFKIIEDAGGHVIEADDVCALLKACKNDVEIQCARQAHIKDGVALAHLLAWLYDCVEHRVVTEMDVVAQLQVCRAEQGAVDDSFNAITGSGPHGAIVHYRVSPQTNRQLLKDELFLLDSGGQYLQGTTDVTRTLCLGTPTDEQKDRFTRVLKGHIQLSCAKFPYGTTGHQLDVLARYSLWQSGLDYAHGTGHGVGSYLSVHEGPQRISKMPNSVALQPGMIISNEPGYYKAGAYGIRIENLMTVIDCDQLSGFENEMLAFETLTLVPIDKKLILTEMLTSTERQWIDDYHNQVRDHIRPLLKSSACTWFDVATAPLSSTCSD